MSHHVVIGVAGTVARARSPEASTALNFGPTTCEIATPMNWPTERYLVAAA